MVRALLVFTTFASKNQRHVLKATISTETQNGKLQNI